MAKKFKATLAAGDVEDSALELIRQAEIYTSIAADNSYDRRKRRRNLLEQARRYAAAVRRLGRLRA